MASPLVILTIWAAGCGSDEPTRPAPIATGVAHPTTPPPDPPGMRTVAVPPGVLHLELGGPNRLDVQLALETMPERELSASAPAVVPTMAWLKATVAEPSDAIVTWANANRVLLLIPCTGDPLPTRIAYVACEHTTVAGLHQLAKAPDLKVVELAGSELAETDLAELPVLPVVEALGLQFGRATDRSLTPVLHMAHLTTLDLSGTHVGNEGIAQLAQMPSLTALDLTSTRVDDAGIAHLAQAIQLQELGLRYTAVGDAGVAALAELPKLEALDLTGTKLDDAGLGRLSANMRLRRIEVTNTGVSAAACDAFNRARNAEVCIKETVSSETATTVTKLDDLEVIELGTRDGTLHDQLLHHRAAAGARPFVVETTASWCPPCIAFSKALHDPAVTKALAGVTLVRVDIDQFASDQLSACNLPPASIPWFVMLDDQLRATNQIAADAWHGDSPETMAPVLARFVKTHHRHAHR